MSDVDAAQRQAVIFLGNQDKLEITLRERNLLAQSGSREFSHQSFFGKSTRAVQISRDATIAIQTALHLSKRYVGHFVYTVFNNLVRIVRSSALKIRDDNYQE